MTNWIQATEQFPPVGKLLIVGRPTQGGADNIFVGFVTPLITVPTWVRVSLVAGGAVQPSNDGSVRTTDYWIPLPEWVC
jgi:hypothetical protein